MYNELIVDENISWKFVYAGVIFSLLVLGLAYWLISVRQAEYSSQSVGENVAEFKNLKLAGRKDGKQSWSLAVSRGWVSKNREFTLLEDVTNGTVYRNSRPVITKLQAPQMRIFQNTDILEALGGKERVRANLNFGRLSQESKDNWAALTADYLRMLPNEKRTEINGHIVISQRPSRLTAAYLIINHQEKSADFTTNVSLQKKNLRLNSDTLRFLSAEEKLLAGGQVTIKITDKSLASVIKAGQAALFVDEKKDVTFWGSVEVQQKNNLAESETGHYSRGARELVLNGMVKAVFYKAGEIINDESARKIRAPEARAIMKEKTFLTADELAFSTQSGNARAAGSVYVTQRGRAAKADHATSYVAAHCNAAPN